MEIFDEVIAFLTRDKKKEKKNEFYKDIITFY